LEVIAEQGGAGICGKKRGSHGERPQIKVKGEKNYQRRQRSIKKKRKVWGKIPSRLDKATLSPKWEKEEGVKGKKKV